MKLKDWIRSKRSLDPKIAEKKEKVRQAIEKATEEGRFSFFEFYFCQDALSKVEKLNDYKRYEFFYDIMNSWEDSCTFSRETGEQLDSFFTDPRTVSAIHRTNAGIIDYSSEVPTSNILNSIMKDGLINNGHAMQGVFMDIPSLSLTTTPVTTFGELVNLVGSYKGNNAIVVLDFPTELVNPDLSFKGEDIYTKKDGYNVIDPQYIRGAVIKNVNGRDRFYTKEQILGTMTKERSR